MLITDSKDKQRDPDPVLVLNDQGGGVMNVSDKPSTLRAQMKHHEPIVCYGVDQQGGKGGANWLKDRCPTILSDSHGTPHAVCYVPKCANCTEYAEADTAATLATKYHYGGGWRRRHDPDETCYGLSRSFLYGGYNGGGIPMSENRQPSITANGPGGVCYAVICLQGDGTTNTKGCISEGGGSTDIVRKDR